MISIKNRLKQYYEEYSKYKEFDAVYVSDVVDMIVQLMDDLKQDKKKTHRLRTLSEVQEDIRTLTRVPSEFIHAKLDELSEEVGELVENQWIPVDTNKPENEEYVFVVLKHTYASDDYMSYSVARYIELSDGHKYWCDDKYGCLEHPKYTDGNGGSSWYKVVAWKPIIPYEVKDE